MKIFKSFMKDIINIIHKYFLDICKSKNINND